MVTVKNFLTAFVLVLIISVPFGYLGGDRKFNVIIWLIGLSILLAGLLLVASEPLLPGTLVQLTEEMIVRGPRGTKSFRSPYRDIEYVLYIRHCTCFMEQDQLVIQVHKGNTTGPLCTVFEVFNRRDNFYSVGRFIAPDTVDLGQILKILRDKKIPVEEKILDAAAA